MSVTWSYKENEEREEVFCRSCSNLTDTPYFISYDRPDSILCLRCARVLARCFVLTEVPVRENRRLVEVPIGGGGICLPRFQRREDDTEGRG